MSHLTPEAFDSQDRILCGGTGLSWSIGYYRKYTRKTKDVWCSHCVELLPVYMLSRDL